MVGSVESIGEPHLTPLNSMNHGHRLKIVLPHCERRIGWLVSFLMATAAITVARGADAVTNANGPNRHRFERFPRGRPSGLAGRAPGFFEPGVWRGLL
jgi:hypothetical protein